MCVHVINRGSDSVVIFTIKNIQMKNTLIYSILLLVSFQSQAQVSFEATPEEMIRYDVAYLASDLLKGRLTGTDGESLAAEYIARRLTGMGANPASANDDWFQKFEFDYSPNPHTSEGKERRTGKNVIGIIDNEADNTIVIGAHYDHLGLGGPGSLYAGEDEIHNGADDNASGVALMLYLAHKLSVNKDFGSFNYLFIGFSGEELGLYGSKYWTQNPTYPLENISCMLNFDMVGRLNEEQTLVINGVGTSPSWTSAFEEAGNGFNIKTTQSGIGASDHTSFYLVDIPAVHFFTGQHTDYHKPGDDAHLVNYDGIEKVGQMILKVISNLPVEEKMEFQKTSDAQDNRSQARFKVTLGVLPDYIYEESGMRIDGVLDGRPASVAGLKGGDVIIKMGDVEVKDIYDYMEALSNFKQGDTTSVTVMRKDKKLEYDVVF